jgi:hypothetical protein
MPTPAWGIEALGPAYDLNMASVFVKNGRLVTDARKGGAVA